MPREETPHTTGDLKTEHGSVPAVLLLKGHQALVVPGNRLVPTSSYLMMLVQS